MAEIIKKRVVPTYETYKYVKSHPYGTKGDLERKVSEQEISSMYNLGFLSCGIDSNKALRYRATDKCLKQASVYCELRTIIDILEKTVVTSSENSDE